MAGPDPLTKIYKTGPGYGTFLNVKYVECRFKNSLFVPCIATVVTIKTEHKNSICNHWETIEKIKDYHQRKLKWVNTCKFCA